MREDLSDAGLLKAVRRRLLGELAAKREREANSQKIVNNVYGSGGPQHMGGGLAEKMHGTGEVDPGLYDYFVDIDRQDKELNPETGKPAGWKKSVHRYRTPKGDGGGAVIQDEKKK